MIRVMILSVWRSVQSFNKDVISTWLRRPYLAAVPHNL